jgi:hypothetical protein
MLRPGRAGGRLLILSEISPAVDAQVDPWSSIHSSHPINSRNQKCPYLKLSTPGHEMVGLPSGSISAERELRFPQLVGLWPSMEQMASKKKPLSHALGKLVPQSAKDFLAMCGRY